MCINKLRNYFKLFSLLKVTLQFILEYEKKLCKHYQYFFTVFFSTPIWVSCIHNCTGLVE